MLIVVPAPAALASPTLPMDDMETVPTDAEILPLKVLLPVSVKVPVPSLETPELPVPLILPLTRVFPLPVKV